MFCGVLELLIITFYFLKENMKVLIKQLFISKSSFGPARFCWSYLLLTTGVGAAVVVVGAAVANNLFSMPSKTNLKRNKKLAASLSSIGRPNANPPKPVAIASKVDLSATVLAQTIVAAGITMLSMNRAGSLKMPVNSAKWQICT